MVFQTMHKQEIGGRKYYGRATRSDKKKQVKICVDDDLHYFIHKLARSKNLSVTKLVTELVSRSLRYRNNIEIFSEIEFDDEEYPDDTLTVNCKLPQPIFFELAEVAAMWRCSIRKAAHRILMFELKRGVRVK